MLGGKQQQQKKCTNKNKHSRLLPVWAPQNSGNRDARREDRGETCCSTQTHWYQFYSPFIHSPHCGEPFVQLDRVCPRNGSNCCKSQESQSRIRPPTPRPSSTLLDSIPTARKANKTMLFGKSLDITLPTASQENQLLRPLSAASRLRNPRHQRKNAKSPLLLLLPHANKSSRTL